MPKLRKLIAAYTVIALTIASVAVLAQGPEPKTAAEEIVERQAAARSVAAKPEPKAAPSVSKGTRSLNDLAASGSQWARRRLSGHAAPVANQTTVPVVRSGQARPRVRQIARPVVHIRNTSVVRPAAMPVAVTKAAAATHVANPVKSVQTLPKSAKTTPRLDDESTKPVFSETGKLPISTTNPIAGIGAVVGFMLKLALVLALAYLSVVALKFYWSRTGKPMRFGARALVVEESAPLSAGTAVHLVNISGKRFMVGTAQGQVSILAALDEDGEIQHSAGGSLPNSSGDDCEESPSAKSAQDNVGMGVFASAIPMMAEAFKKRSASSKDESRQSSAAPMAAKTLSSDIRKSTQFLDELRTRLDSQEVA